MRGDPSTTGPARPYPAKVLEVIDGDTAKFAIRLRQTRMAAGDLGFHVYVEGGSLVLHESVRFFGINAAEHATPAGDAATAYLNTLLHPGDAVKLLVAQVAGHDEQEKYGRWLAVVIAGTVNINDLMVSSGHAKPWDGHGPRPV